MSLQPLLAATSPGVANDRGIVREVLVQLGVSPATAHAVQVYTVGPLRILLVLVLAGVSSRLVTRMSGRLVRGLRLVSPIVGSTPRADSRAKTLTGAFTSVFRAVIWVAALLTVLGQLDVNLVPFVATATVVGAAVGFGAQSLVKDFLSGVLILAEDQYGVGDTIVVGSSPASTTGTVESINLRTTRLRALDGVVWYVPNGDIRTVGNASYADGQAVVDVTVPLGTDLPAAGRAAVEEARSMAAEEQWRDLVLAEPAFGGVASSDQGGATIRILLRTRAGARDRVASELRLRVLERLREAGLAWH